MRIFGACGKIFGFVRNARDFCERAGNFLDGKFILATEIYGLKRIELRVHHVNETFDQIIYVRHRAALLRCPM